MNINKSNFSNIYPLMANEINECNLIAFDLNNSDIKLTEQNNYNLFDSMEDRYQLIKNYSESFTSFHLRIVLFTRITDERSNYLNKSKFLTKAYNISIFPTGSDLFDTNFSCSAAALKFLRTKHMDINEIIDNGVGFLNKDEFAQLKSRLNSNVQEILTEEQQSTMDSQRRQIFEWLTTANNENIQLPPIDRFSPYLQQMYFRSHFKGISTKYVDDCILVEKVDASTRLAIDQKEDDMDPTSEKYKILMDMLGVSKIWKLISQLKKPIVGHNCLFDLITVYQRFFAPLPETFDEFRFELNKVLPTIYDTKFVFGRMRMNFEELAEIEGYRLQTIFNALALLNLNSYHEGVYIEEHLIADGAGAESYMTGCCLLYLANMLYKAQNSEVKQPRKIWGRGDNFVDEVVQQPLKIWGPSFETYETFLKSWKSCVNVIKAHQLYICFDVNNVDNEFRSESGNKLMDTRPPFLIVYDSRPHLGPLPLPEMPDDNNVEFDPDNELYLSHGFLEQMLFEFGHANVRRLDEKIVDERFQRYLVAMPSYNVMRLFMRNVKKKWPRLTVREYNKLADDRWTRNWFLAVTGLGTLVSIGSLFGLLALHRK